jgi:hypothetical protein
LRRLLFLLPLAACEGTSGTSSSSAAVAKDGSSEIYCSIDGHRGQGMAGTVAVGNGSSSGGMTTGETTTSGSPGY